MRRLFTTTAIFVAAIFVMTLLNCSSSIAQETESTTKPIRAMSFNIRLGVAKDGANHWDKRKEIVAKTILKFDADLVGTQETWDFQAEYLAKALSAHTYVGRSRQSDGKGEQCGIFFRKSRFDKLTEGHFWLSKTPDQPGSKSWDSSLPRMATWLKLWDRENRQSVFIINTHFDHRGKTARSEGSKLIRKFVNSLPTSSHVIVTGDFNAPENSSPYRSLFAELDGNQSPLLDTYRKIRPIASNEEGTFSAFNGKKTGSRIDWVGCSRNFQIESAEIDRSSFDGRFPSDHYPVTAVLSFGGSAAKD
ncbi:MAG: endonuclease/exonuclease/phosphatase family protein [Mariniblastus sp.]